jgi:hypothetical protein
MDVLLYLIMCAMMGVGVRIAVNEQNKKRKKDMEEAMRAALGRPPDALPPDREKQPAVETCANCGVQIGQLETPFVWKDKIVCAACHRRLATANLPQPIPPAPRK